MPPKSRVRNPFRGVMDVMSEMSRISDAMSTVDTHGPADVRGFADAWTPTTDIFARGSDLVIRSELPGVSSDMVEVSFSHGVLSITGERLRGEDEENAIYYASERFYGTFRRDITLPEGVDEDDIEGKFDEGLLEVTVRNAAEASAPKRIRVSSKKKS
ncbi:Hsp20/alpha crystallin family protein [Lipingzhangella sp. LS1_29]|uniref:Hsp20/alpha crystallin family protein n=1 Tax=Lipingzhangella rawalii TaxID=2055835 RepID=A0ABU2H845_9ACTN|nr:Hsp20/alpha crystallin family protein [Lipingzhangella rawalii]MDS1271010.1 Hsp20/alpha crystallin family protein [Lipingzhangella rawalii]